MRIFIVIFLLLSSSIAFGQIQTPRISPSSELEQMVGLTEIEIDYTEIICQRQGNLWKSSSVWKIVEDRC